MGTLPEEYGALEGKRALVTGAAGFIGGALYRRLREYGVEVIGTVREESEAEALRQSGGKSEVLDLLSDEPWDEILRGVDVVFHLAAVFQEIESGPEEYEKGNHHASRKLVETAARVGVTRFVHCSTVGVHGDVKEIPAKETTPFNPMDVYHRTKLRGELAVLDFTESLPADGMVVTVNRPAMVYGPGDLRMLKIFRTILSGRFRMIGSGKTLAHLGFIDDQVDSFLLMAVAPREKVHGEPFNIASDRPLTLNEFARTIAECGGVRLSGVHIPVAPVWFAGLLCEILCRPIGVRPPLFRRRVGFFTHNRAFDVTKAEERIGYRSKWPNREGIARTIEWYRGQGLV